MQLTSKDRFFSVEWDEEFLQIVVVKDIGDPSRPPSQKIVRLNAEERALIAEKMKERG